MRISATHENFSESRSSRSSSPCSTQRSYKLFSSPPSTPTSADRTSTTFDSNTTEMTGKSNKPTMTTTTTTTPTLGRIRLSLPQLIGVVVGSIAFGYVFCVSVEKSVVFEVSSTVHTVSSTRSKVEARANPLKHHRHNSKLRSSITTEGKEEVHKTDPSSSSHHHHHHRSSKHSDDALRSNEGRSEKRDDADDDWADEGDDEATPKLAWLMTFPNSGTSFTTKLIRHISGMSTATNYGEEYVDRETRESVPWFVENSMNHTGPYLIDPQRYGRPRGKMYLLTKTHCGGRCDTCGPRDYVETPYSFLFKCLSGGAVIRDENGDGGGGSSKDQSKRQLRSSSHRGSGHRGSGTSSGSGSVGKTTSARMVGTSYSIDLIRRVVHLIRNPFDNVVSRFHLEKTKNSTEVSNFGRDREGFRQFCRHFDDKWSDRERASPWWDDALHDMIRHIPCHGDFYRYAMFHNLVFAITTDLGLPTMVLHYERYGTDFDGTLRDLVDFLRIEPRGEVFEFIGGKSYVDYFERSERKIIKRAMKLMSFKSTWDAIEPYFDDL